MVSTFGHLTASLLWVQMAYMHFTFTLDIACIWMTTTEPIIKIMLLGLRPFRTHCKGLLTPVLNFSACPSHHKSNTLPAGGNCIDISPTKIGLSYLGMLLVSHCPASALLAQNVQRHSFISPGWSKAGSQILNMENPSAWPYVPIKRHIIHYSTLIKPSFCT